MKNRKLIQEQLDRKFAKFSNLHSVVIPPDGWIYSIRQGLHMSLRQLAARLSITPQSVKEIEEREKNGTVSLNVLKQVASALDMHFVYGFIPRDGSLEKMVEKKAIEKSKKIVERTSIQMTLEDQEVSSERIEKSIREKAEQIARELPGYLWD